ncbi:hypothetical protein BKA24_001758 [Microbacterium marinum]|uniref:Uncharacterized protein n=1 Tax=Microbacterium marinum TaxID=421115 RepID=A0A7W7BQM3_9MICO|nr:hypothetical protein [Microbacterium marinum]MBB4667049.1 hypothetical protein [Microbacterium marinum]
MHTATAATAATATDAAPTAANVAAASIDPATLRQRASVAHPYPDAPDARNYADAAAAAGVRVVDLPAYRDALAAHADAAAVIDARRAAHRAAQDARAAAWMLTHTDAALRGPAVAKRRATARNKVATSPAVPRMSDDAFARLYADNMAAYGRQPVADAATLAARDAHTAAERTADDARHAWREANGQASARTWGTPAPDADTLRAEADRLRAAFDAADVVRVRTGRELAATHAANVAAHTPSDARAALVTACRDAARADVLTGHGNNLPRTAADTFTDPSGKVRTLSHMSASGIYGVGKGDGGGYVVYHRAARLTVPVPTPLQGAKHANARTLTAAREWMAALEEAAILEDVPEPIADAERRDALRTLHATYGQPPAEDAEAPADVAA